MKPMKKTSQNVNWKAGIEEDITGIQIHSKSAPLKQNSQRYTKNSEPQLVWEEKVGEKGEN